MNMDDVVKAMAIKQEIDNLIKFKGFVSGLMGTQVTVINLPDWIVANTHQQKFMLKFNANNSPILIDNIISEVDSTISSKINELTAMGVEYNPVTEIVKGIDTLDEVLPPEDFNDDAYAIVDEVSTPIPPDNSDDALMAAMITGTDVNND